MGMLQYKAFLLYKKLGHVLQPRFNATLPTTKAEINQSSRRQQFDNSHTDYGDEDASNVEHDCVQEEARYRLAN